MDDIVCVSSGIDSKWNGNPQCISGQICDDAIVLKFVRKQVSVGIIKGNTLIAFKVKTGNLCGRP